MGGQQSTRKVTIENDQLIAVSSNVVQRLHFMRNGDMPGPPPLENVDEIALWKAKAALESQRAIDQELHKCLSYWEKRLAKQKHIHGELESIAKREYHKANEEINQILPKLGAGEPPEEFKGISRKITSCLRQNKRQPLLCSSEIEEFNTFFKNYNEAPEFTQ